MKCSILCLIQRNTLCRGAQKSFLYRALHTAKIHALVQQGENLMLLGQMIHNIPINCHIRQWYCLPAQGTFDQCNHHTCGQWNILQRIKSLFRHRIFLRRFLRRCFSFCHYLSRRVFRSCYFLFACFLGTLWLDVLLHCFFLCYIFQTIRHFTSRSKGSCFPQKTRCVCHRYLRLLCRLHFRKLFISGVLYHLT